MSMRISTSYEYQLYTNDIDSTTLAYNNAEQAVSTGKAINEISDNPTGVMDALNMTALQAQITQFNSNLGTAKDYLSTNEDALTQVTNLMTQAYQLAVEGANGSNDSASMNALAGQISDIQSSLVNVANTQNSSGQYIFAGQNTNTKPFNVGSGKITYTGDSGSINVEVAPGNQMTVNTPGSPLFTTMYSQLQSLKLDLQSGNQSKITNSDIANLKASMNTVSDLNGQFGAQIDTVTTLTSNNTQRLTDLATSLSSIENVNIAAAAVTLSQAQNAYQAALEVTSNANKYNLVDFLSGT